jgi:cytochrome b pre-mRNA-processing protein 3
MLRHLFGGLTERTKRGQALFDRIVEEARSPHWFVEGQVPDTIDGRFAMLATVCALVIVRLESGSEDGARESAALTERFVEAMDAEHRELGLNDPGLGRRVRKLVGSLERRVDEWRAATASELGWSEAVTSSVYRGTEPVTAALGHNAGALEELWQLLKETPERKLIDGAF